MIRLKAQRLTLSYLSKETDSSIHVSLSLEYSVKGFLHINFAFMFGSYLNFLHSGEWMFS